MSDLISRQAAIDAVCMEWCGVKHQDCKHPFDVEKDDYYWCDRCETALRTLLDLPSAEPEKVLIAKITLSEEQVREAVEKAKKEIVQMLPPAEPKHGKWIDAVIPNDNGGLLVQVCDQCNTFFPLAYTGGGHNFCPNCGADMRGEQDE